MSCQSLNYTAALVLLLWLYTRTPAEHSHSVQQGVQVLGRWTVCRLLNSPGQFITYLRRYRPQTYGQFLRRSRWSVGARNFHLGATAQWVWEGKYASEVQGRSPGRASTETEVICRHCLQILTTETIKIRQFRTIHLLILDHVSRWVGA